MYHVVPLFSDLSRYPLPRLDNQLEEGAEEVAIRSAYFEIEIGFIILCSFSDLHKVQEHAFYSRYIQNK